MKRFEETDPSGIRIQTIDLDTPDTDIRTGEAGTDSIQSKDPAGNDTGRIWDDQSAQEDYDEDPDDAYDEDDDPEGEDGHGWTKKHLKKRAAGRTKEKISVFLDSPAVSDRSHTGRNTELAITAWLFVGLFALLIGYLVYIEIVRKPVLTSSVYYTREDAASSNTVRGSIVTEEGENLAYTSIDYSGNEVRSYPYGRIFAHTIGYATNGRAGLEASCNTQLMSSHSSLISQIQDAGSGTKTSGDTVVVTLDPTLQQAAWYALGDYRGAVVAMEPDSGRILAMVSKPDFDPNTISQDWDWIVSDENASFLLNRATQGLYPPGSTFKILTTLAYLREHPSAYESFMYDCSGMLTQGDVTITCYNQTVHGEESLRTAFANSCNTAFASIGLELDNSRFKRLAEEFLFNTSLPIGLTHSKSVFKLSAASSYGEQMTTAIGQGDTLVTPLHMAMITSAVANAGTMMKPYLVSRVISAEGNVISETKPEIYKEMMTTTEAMALSSFMRETVLSGTGAALSWNSYTVAGKTGSAEYTHGDSTGTHSWFVGFCNVDDPELVVAVIAEDGGTGSTTAVPIAQKIFDAYYWG